MVVVIRLSEKRRSIKITHVAIPNMHRRGIKKILLRATRLLIPLPAMRREIILLIKGGRGVQASAGGVRTHRAAHRVWQDKGMSVERGDPCLCASRESLRRSNKSVRWGSCRYTCT